MNVVGIVYGLLSAISFALSPIFYKLGSKNVTSLEANSLRSVMTLPIAYVLFIIVNNSFFPSLSLNVIIWGFLLAFIGGVIGDTLYILSVKIIGPSLALAISSTYALFSVIFAMFILNETVSFWIFISLFFILLGIFIIYLTLMTEKRILGFISAILCAVSWGFFVFLSKVAMIFTSNIELQFFRMVFLALILAPIIIKSKRKIRKENMLYLTIGGSFGLVIGFYSLLLTIETAGISFGATISSSSPALTPILSKIILNEKLRPRQILGIIITLVGILILTLKT